MSKRVESISHQSPREIENYINRITGERTIYHSLLEQIDRAVCLCDDSGRIFYSNSLFSSMFGYAEEVPFFKLVIDNDIREAFATTYTSHTVYDGEFRMSRGEYIHIHGFPYSDKYYAYFITDITKRKKEQFEFRRLESLAALGNVSAILAHDINNPLSAISVQSDLLSRAVGRRDENFFYEHIDIIKNEIERIKDIVRNFLFSARPLEITPLLQDSALLIDNIINFVTPDLTERGIKFITDIHKPLPYVEMDYNLIYSSVINLIKNAVEALEETDEPLINFTAMRYMNNFVMTISDNGSGISDSAMENIFKPYFTTKKTGTGLGLSCVYKIVKLHAGDVQVKRLEKGTSFSISLPLNSDNYMAIGVSD